MEIWFYIAAALFPFALVGVTTIYYEFAEIFKTIIGDN